MRDTHEPPICHRAEDLVSYLYDEASTADALDFRNHLQQCDACRREFTVFNQVHDSIQLWRNEALGASFSPAAVVSEPATDSRQFVRHERRLSALAALREFFSVSPLWLRGATAFAALLLCVLAVMMLARGWRQRVDFTAINSERTYSQEELKAEIAKAVNETRQALANRKNESSSTAGTKQEQRHSVKQTQMAAHQPKNVQPRNLNRQERVQLAADLRLTLPAEEEELLLALPEQDIPRQ